MNSTSQIDCGHSPLPEGVCLHREPAAGDMALAAGFLLSEPSESDVMGNGTDPRWSAERTHFAEMTYQNTVASLAVTYGSPGFVTSANYAAYDSALQTARTTRDTWNLVNCGAYS